MLIAEFDLKRRLVAEALGAAFLVAAVVGSGIMAERLTQDTALQLLCNTLPTGAALVVLISMLGPISGAHFNPAVSLVFAARGELSRSETALYVVVQVAGGIAGTMIAHSMFGPPGFRAFCEIPHRWWPMACRRRSYLWTSSHNPRRPPV